MFALFSKPKLKSLKNQPKHRLSSLVNGSRCLSFGFKSNAESAGLSVSELTAEKKVETAIVRANCLKNWPVIPVMNAHGMNTHIKTSEIAMIGPDTSFIAFIAASFGDKPCSKWCSTASTTTIASSTTMPIASTSPNNERLLRLNPIPSMTAKVPTIATGTAISGISVARHDCRKASTTIATRMIASRSALKTSWIDSVMNGVVS